MNRSITNIIHFLMDECLPPVIRDNRFFMWPFYFIAYRGKNIRQIMDFKKHVYRFTSEEYNKFYSELDTISRNRLTDINGPSLRFILQNLDKESQTLIDVGCGKGYLLKQIKKSRPDLQLYGADVVDKYFSSEFEYKKANIESLPFPDKSFDIVTCCHTIEHIIHLEKAIEELIRVARKQLIIVTPCQRYYYYTLDEHVNFFPDRGSLTGQIHLKDFICKKIWGDWVYVAVMLNPSPQS